MNVWVIVGALLLALVQYVNRQRCCVSCFDADGKPHLWPCPDAELIYPTEELT